MTPAMTGLILAGGASTRMRQDKVLLSLHGRRLVDHAVDVLTPLCERLLVAARGRWIPGLYVEGVDDAPGEGPLAAIVGGLRAAATPLVAVLAADMPFSNGDVLQRLAALWDGEAAVVPEAGGRIQPLHAVYATAAAPTFETMLASGERSVTAALAAAAAKIAGPAQHDPQGTAGEFWANINSPEDLARLGARREGQ